MEISLTKLESQALQHILIEYLQLMACEGDEETLYTSSLEAFSVLKKVQKKSDQLGLPILVLPDCFVEDLERLSKTK